MHSLHCFAYCNFLLDTAAERSEAGEPKPLGGGVGQDGAKRCVFAYGNVPGNNFPAVLEERARLERKVEG